MNIKDFVKYDERSEKLIDKKFNKKLDVLNEKYDGYLDSIVYLDEKQKILDRKNELIDRLKKSNCPFKDEALLVEMAIDWAEANKYTSFTRAMRDVLNEIAEDGKTFDGNLLEDDKHEDITVEEAKQMFKKSDTDISETMFNESLKLYRRTVDIHPWKELDNVFHVSDYKCSITINDVEHEIPIMVIKQIIASATRMNFSTDPQKLIKELRAIKLPNMRIRWPKE